jgi:phenylalanyl-tRNA synthetase beta chain
LLDIFKRVKISLNWLQQFIQLTETDPQKICDVLTEKSAEVDGILDMGKGFEHVVTGKILEIFPHPDADRVRVTKTDVGDGTLRQIICGAKNIEVGQVVPVALPGAVLPGDFAIEARKMRGVMSEGMLCSGKELGLTEDAEGIMILDPNLSLGKPVADVLGLDGVVFDIDNQAITNRPDLFSHHGFAREFVALNLGKWKEIQNSEFRIQNKRIEMLNVYPKESQQDFQKVIQNIPDSSLPIAFDVQNGEICPARADVVIENVVVAPSPEWMQNRLRECGIRPINNIVDISNFVMLELGMPLHTFDLETISDNKITMRESKKGEKVVTLDSVTRELPEGVIIQEDDQKVFDLAGIMGGENSEISDSTTKVLVHVPVYDPIRIRKAAMALGHRTDASTIYEKRVPNASVMPGIIRTIQLILEMCTEAKLASKIEFVEHAPSMTREISLPKKMASRIIGTQIPDEEMIRILESLGFEIHSQTENELLVNIPPHRLQDVSLAEDLAEEIARVYGFNTIAAHAPEISIRPAALTPLRRIRREVSDLLTAHGFYEALNFAFLGPELLHKCGVKPDESFVEIANPISADMSLMRQSLLPRLLEKSMENGRHQDSLSLFEIGKTFVKVSEEDVREATMVSGILCGAGFLELKGVLEAIFHSLHLPLRLAELSSPSPFAAQGAQIIVGGSVIGEIAVPKKAIKKSFDLPEETAYFSFDLSEMAEFPQKHVSVASAPKFPEIVLDISVLAEKNTYSSDVVRVVNKIDPLVVSSDLLEIYEGDDLPEGKKSITLRFIFRAPDRTLSSQEADGLKKKILEKLEKKGYPFRFHEGV